MKALSYKKSISKRRKIIIFAVILALIVAGGAGTYYYMNRGGDPESEKLKTVENNYVDSKDLKNNQDSSGSSSSQHGEKVTSSNTNVDSEASPEKPNITRAEQTGEYVRVSVVLTQASNGRCTLKLEKNGYSTLTKEVPVIIASTYYTCNGFRVPRSELPVGGEWVATVEHYLNGKKSSSDRRMINVQ